MENQKTCILRPTKWLPKSLALILLLLANTALIHSKPTVPNIVWVTCEDMSPLLGCYGDEFASTPNLDAFAERSIRYTNAWSTMPICAPARSTLITGCYSTSLGTMNLRAIVPQSSRVVPFPKILRENGYYCTNRHKTDYNFSHEGIWDDSSTTAHWRNRPDSNQPFFHVVNYQSTHEGPTNGMSDPESPYAARHCPDDVPLPIFFPDTPEMRDIMAHHYDLISAMDAFFGKVISDLEEDGLADDTIVFFFSDHGGGYPRHKRFLYESGLLVPLMVHVPDKYKDLSYDDMATVSDRLVGFVDMAATVLTLAGIEPPEFLQGHDFLRARTGQPYLYGARDRADDLQDLSRTVRDKRYRYTRNYMPYLPYIRDAAIFSPRKGTHRVLVEEMSKPDPKPETAAMFAPKPVEELFDLEKDPHELNNLAYDPAYTDIKRELKSEMEAWIMRIRDAAFLPEGEMMRRAAHDSVYDMAQDPLRYDLETILEAAEKCSHPATTIEEIATYAASPDSGVRYWAACGLLGREGKDRGSRKLINQLFADQNPCVSIVAAETLIRMGLRKDEALDHLIGLAATFADTEPTIAMQAARALVEVGEQARPVLDQVAVVLEQIKGPVWDNYRNWYYQMFLGMSLHPVKMNCGMTVERYL